MSPIDQKTRPLKENHLIQRVLHRPVELARLFGTYIMRRLPALRCMMQASRASCHLDTCPRCGR